MAVMSLADAAQLGRRPGARIEKIAEDARQPPADQEPRRRTYRNSGFGSRHIAEVMRYATVRGYFQNNEDQQADEQTRGYVGFSHPDGKTARIITRVDGVRTIYNFWVEDRTGLEGRV